MKTSAHFERYKHGYMTAEQDASNGKTYSEGATDMIKGWDDFVAEVGHKRALKAFWDWQRTLEPEMRSDCDPDGN